MMAKKVYLQPEIICIEQTQRDVLIGSGDGDNYGKWNKDWSVSSTGGLGND